MTYWREASTLMLAASVREHECTSAFGSLGDEDYRILMLRRSASASFMPSTLVFPGGTLEDVDHSDEWSGLFESVIRQPLGHMFNSLHVIGIRPPMLKKLREWKTVTADIAFRICAIRETFEECGILLVTHSGACLNTTTKFEIPHISDAHTLRSWQHRVCQDSAQFLVMCRELGVVPNVWALHEWSNWLTPVIQQSQGPSQKPNRFDTMFYICCLDCKEPPSAVIDNEEAVQQLWSSPSELLRLDLHPPQFYELGRIVQFHHLDDLAVYCHNREKFGVEVFMPVFRLCAGGIVIFYPGDFMYPTDPDFLGMDELQAGLEQSAVELCDTCNNSLAMNRFVIFIGGSAKKTRPKLICTVPFATGHTIPVSAADIAKQSKM